MNHKKTDTSIVRSEVKEMTLPTTNCEISILPNHIPIATTIDIGILRIHLNSDRSYTRTRKTRPVYSGYGYEKLKKNEYWAGTLKMGMGRVWVWV